MQCLDVSSALIRLALQWKELVCCVSPSKSALYIHIVFEYISVREIVCFGLFLHVFGLTGNKLG